MTIDLGYWSASRFMTWEMCPSEFEQVYVFGNRPEPSEAMLFGSAVHQGLEAHYNGADGIASFRGAWKAMRDEYRLQADSRLTGVGMDLIDLVVAQGWSGLPERVFAIDTKSAWGFPTVGAIDLTSIDGRSITIRDFKTTTGEWGEARAHRDPWQPVLYATAIAEAYDIWPAFEYVVLNKIKRSLSIFRLEPEETEALSEEVNFRACAISETVQSGVFTCSGKHGDCLECGARFDHGHVCDMNVRAPRIGSATREARAR